jgi:hypothetical protein
MQYFNSLYMLKKSEYSAELQQKGSLASPSFKAQSTLQPTYTSSMNVWSNWTTLN